MTPQEIQALINAKIAGQGSAVDVGGALPQILSGILELAQAGLQKTVLAIEMEAEDSTIEQVLSLLKINGKQPTLDEMLNIEVGDVVFSDGYGEMLVTYVLKSEGLFLIEFGFYSDNFGTGGQISLHLSAPTELDSYIKLFDI